MIKVGVIGVGSMGQNHARVYSEIADLVGVCDVNKEYVKKVATRFNTKWYTNYKEFLRTDVEAVTIATPTKTHFQIAKAAIAAGKHILIEKPACSTLEESNELLKLANKHKSVVCVGYIERYNPVVSFAKRALTEKRFGDLITLASKRVSSFPTRIKDVGVILDLGTHDIDVMRHLAGAEVESIYAQAGITNNADFENYANIMLSFENEVTGIIEVNWLTPMKVRKLWLTCSSNFVELDYIAQSLEISSATIMEYDTANLYQVPYEFDIRRVNLKKQEPLKIELNDLIASIQKRRKPLVNLEEAIKTFKVAQAALKSYKKKEKVLMKNFCG